MAPAAMKEQVGDQLHGIKKMGTDIVQGEPGEDILPYCRTQCLLGQKDQQVDYDQILYYRRYVKKSPWAKLCHILKFLWFG
jgi:hypothetical protein